MANCANSGINQLPINDLGGSFYSGIQQGGLYPSGSNIRPAAHEAAGIALAAQIVPLNNNGIPSPTGKVGFVGMGMSNAERTFIPFRSQFNADPATKKTVKLVEACVYGRTAEQMSNPADPYWTVDLPNALNTAGVKAIQVQVVWIMEGMKDKLEPYPTHVDTLAGYWKSIVQIARTKFPNLKIAYLDMMQYMGYGVSTPAEPYFFEQGFAIKKVIEDQINGDPALAYPTLAPWLSWGHYFWSDGVKPRSDGMTWLCPTDCIGDGVHQSTIGAAKMATRLLNTLKADTTCQGWMV